jgi:hypothetical protein
MTTILKTQIPNLNMCNHGSQKHQIHRQFVTNVVSFMKLDNYEVFEIIELDGFFIKKFPSG